MQTAAPPAAQKDQQDESTARFGRARHDGFKRCSHNHIQPTPLFFTQDHHPLWLADTYRGRSAFLIASGPSFGSLDHAPLSRPGVITMGVNNSPRTFRPNLWTCVDQPDHWIRSIWLDPAIQKFCPIGWSAKRLFNTDSWKFMDTTVGDCPNIVYFKRNEHFKAKQFLWEDCINWGMHTKLGGGRSVLLPALRILFLLGFRKIYLLGVDFNMAPDRTYHFDQKRHGSSCRGNQSTYEKLKGWFTELRPHFEAAGCKIFNCNPDSALKAFPMISYKEALESCADEMDAVDYANERTRNLYETETREKEEGYGAAVTWFRVDNHRKYHKCKYCGKRCVRVAGDETKPGLLMAVAGCERSRQKLWQRKGDKLFGPREAVQMDWKPEAELIAEWNRRFGREEGK